MYLSPAKSLWKARTPWIVVSLLILLLVFEGVAIFKENQDIDHLEEMVRLDEGLYPDLTTFHRFPISGTSLSDTPSQ